LRQAEIQNFDPAIFGEKDVFGLQVSVGDAPGMRGRQPVRYGDCDIQRFG
jgi:hypothetical protein